MASPAPKRLEPLESLKYQRRMRLHRQIRLVSRGLLVAAIVMSLVRAATSQPRMSAAHTVTLLVWSRQGALGAAFIQTPPGATQEPPADRRSVATVVLLVDQPNSPPNWLERQYGGPLMYTSSFTLAALDPSPGFEPLSESDRAGLAKLLEAKCGSLMPRGPKTIPPLNGTRTRLFLDRFTGVAAAALFGLWVTSLAVRAAYGFCYGLSEGLRSGISPRACPSCDFDLSATPPLTGEPDPDPSPVTGGRVYRQCPECGWKGRV